MFGLEATKVLDYVECFPNGAGKGRTMASECSAVGIEGFPTWVIKGKVRNITSRFIEKFSFVLISIHKGLHIIYISLHNKPWDPKL